MKTIDEIFANQAELKSQLRELYHDGVLDNYFNKMLHSNADIHNTIELLKTARQIHAIETEIIKYLADPIAHSFHEDDLSKAADQLRDLEEIVNEKKDIIIENIDSIGDQLYEDKEQGDVFVHHPADKVRQYILVLETLGDKEGADRIKEIISTKTKRTSKTPTKRKKEYESLIEKLKDTEKEIENIKLMEPTQQHKHYQQILSDLENVANKFKKYEYFSDADKVKHIMTYVENLRDENIPTYRVEKNRKTLIGLTAIGILLTALGIYQIPRTMFTLSQEKVQNTPGTKIEKVLNSTESAEHRPLCSCELFKNTKIGNSTLTLLVKEDYALTCKNYSMFIDQNFEEMNRFYNGKPPTGYARSMCIFYPKEMDKNDVGP